MPTPSLHPIKHIKYLPTFLFSFLPLLKKHNHLTTHKTPTNPTLTLLPLLLKTFHYQHTLPYLFSQLSSPYISFPIHLHKIPKHPTNYTLPPIPYPFSPTPTNSTLPSPPPLSLKPNIHSPTPFSFLPYPKHSSTSHKFSTNPSSFPITFFFFNPFTFTQPPLIHPFQPILTQLTFQTNTPTSLHNSPKTLSITQPHTLTTHNT